MTHGPNRAKLETYLQGVEAASADLDTAIDNWKTVSVRLANASTVLSTQKGRLALGFGEDSDITTAATGAFERSTTKLDDKSQKIFDGWNALVIVRWRLQNALDARTRMDKRLADNPDPGREPQKTDAAYAGVGGSGHAGWKADHETWASGHADHTGAYDHAETASAHHIQLLDTAFGDANTALRKVHGDQPVTPPGGSRDGGSGGPGSSGTPSDVHVPTSTLVGDPRNLGGRPSGGGGDGGNDNGGNDHGGNGGNGGDGGSDNGGSGGGGGSDGGGTLPGAGGGTGPGHDPGRTPGTVPGTDAGDGHLDGGIPRLPGPGGVPPATPSLPSVPAAAGAPGAFEIGDVGAGVGGLSMGLPRGASAALPTTGMPGIGAGGRSGGPGVVGGAAPGGNRGGRSGGAGTGGGRGGRAGAAGAGRGGRRSRDREKGAGRDLWDDGEDWIDDEGAGPSVLE